MTTIVAVQYADHVKMAADAQVTLGDGRIMRDPRMVKITVRNGYLVAGAGDVAPCDIAQHIWNPPKPTAIDKRDLYHFVIAKVVPSLKKCLKDNDYKIERTTTDPDSGFDFLIAVNGQVFHICDNFSVLVDESCVYGIGSGTSHTMSMLRNGSTIGEALEYSKGIDAFTSGQIAIATQYANGNTTLALIDEE